MVESQFLSPIKVLKKYWGYSTFLGQQEASIKAILDNKDVLTIFPTGAGKSLCYQIPALMMSGICIVISPLVALMKDQVERLKKLDINAAFLDANTSIEDERIIMDNVKSGYLKLLYFSPERLSTHKTLAYLSNLPISFLAIDEAHCVSQWGHDFRVSFLKIKDLKKVYPDLKFAAFTATATLKVQKEIVELLDLHDPKIIKSDFNKSNITYNVKETDNKDKELLYYLNKYPGSGIVFTNTRRKAYELSKYLQFNGFNADFFHAGLESNDKNKKQKAWMDGDSSIMVATIAFGMGIDKSNVRKVIHYNIPTSVEGYFQEVGRAGRDGNSSHGILLYNKNDINKMESIFKSNFPSKTEFNKIISALYDEFQIAENELPENSFILMLQNFINKHKLHKSKVKAVLSVLNNQEIIQFSKPYTSQVRLHEKLKNDFLEESTQFKILDFLMRQYDGIFHNYIKVDEYKIALALEIPVDKVYDTLSVFNEKLILSYSSKKNLSIRFLFPRNTLLTKSHWKKFSEIQLNKWNKIQHTIFYVQNKNDCRKLLLQRYFGDKPNEKCLECDNCTTIKPIEIDDLMDFLKQKPSTLANIITHFIDYPKKSVLDALEHLINEEIVSKEKNIFFI